MATYATFSKEKSVTLRDSVSVSTSERSTLMRRTTLVSSAS